MKFSQFLTRFAMSPPLEITKPTKPAFVARPLHNPSFVEPEIEIESWPEGARVVLIEAPGAVGKSVTAHAIAASLGWPLILAQLAQVGDYSLSGLIQQSLGFDTTHFQAMTLGKSGVVIDSLDEAHLKAGTQNFLAFIENIAELGASADTSTPPPIILLSRLDTADLVKLFFADKGIPLALAEISYFNEPSAQKFVRTYLKRRHDETQRSDYNIPFSHPGPFADLLNAHFLKIMRVIQSSEDVSISRDWGDCCEFLGYSPVLTAIAESVAVPNPSNELSRVRSQRHSSEEELFTAIIESILDREHEKFSLSTSGKLRATQGVEDDKDMEVGSLYSRNEQLVRIACRVKENALACHPPVDLPASIRSEYEKMASQFISDHPFVRGDEFSSVIFADYTRAHNASSHAARALLKYDPTNVAHTGPFFCLFYRRLASAPPLLPESLIEPLILSWQQESRGQSGRKSGNHAFISVRDSEGVLLLTADGILRGRRNADYVFGLAELSGVIQLSNVPSNVTITTNGAILLGTRNTTLSIGEGSTLMADIITIESEGLVSTFGRAGSPSVVIGATVEGNYIRKVEIPRESLILLSEDAPLALHSYLTEMPRLGSYENRPSDFVALRAILTSFHQTVHYPGPSVPRDLLAKITMRDDLMRQSILQELIERGIIVQKDSWFILQTQRLTEVGFSLRDISLGRPTIPIVEFLQACRNRLNGANDQSP